MNNIKVNIKKMNDRAVLPKYGSAYAAGADLYSCEGEITVPPHATAFVHTGLCVEIPQGFVGLIYARSGLACKRNLAPANKVGVIDSDYRGEIMVALHNHGDRAETVAAGERVAQMVIAPYYMAEYCEVNELSDTVRGEGGFGSTGRK